MWKTALLAILVSLVSGAGPAQAADRTTDMTLVLRDENGRPIRDAAFTDDLGKSCVNALGSSSCPVLTLGRAVAHVLYAQFDEDRQLDPAQKAARALLARQIENNRAAQLSSPQITVIETLLGRAYGGLILSQAFLVLDPNLKLPDVK